ncbi:hypothetical protein [Paenibacillus piri]|uniref:Uncharacterized protein n=1 Tax=Paenibacillus piri TaxID=2547395 RepID=A0A4V2ZTD6_9BACL|nr:hypothetical protein [Paenibacillus piri]TDF96614.1 hypothetical protein E1757_16085 [Paenibacillus piri]
MSAGATKHLYIKHAVGSRMLFDVSASGNAFELLSSSGGGWKFVIADVEPDTVQCLRDNLMELNLFYFIEQPGQPVQKSWLYDKACPVIEYDDGSRQCVIEVDSKVEYNNENV